MTIITSGKLSRRLFLLTTRALAPMAAILFYNVAAGRAEREIHVEALRFGQLTALEMQRVVNGLDNVLTTLAAAAVVQTMEPEQCSKLIPRVAHNLPQFSSVSVVDRQGIIRCRQNPAGIGISLID